LYKKFQTSMENSDQIKLYIFSFHNDENHYTRPVQSKMKLKNLRLHSRYIYVCLVKSSGVGHGLVWGWGFQLLFLLILVYIKYFPRAMIAIKSFSLANPEAEFFFFRTKFYTQRAFIVLVSIYTFFFLTILLNIHFSYFYELCVSNEKLLWIQL